MAVDISDNVVLNGGKTTGAAKATANGEYTRYDEMKNAAPGTTGDYAGYTAGGQIFGEDPTADEHYVNRRFHDAAKAVVPYAQVDTSVAPSNGDIISQGPVPYFTPRITTNFFYYYPGYARRDSSKGTAAAIGFPFFIPNGTGSQGPGSYARALAPGSKLFLRGHYHAITDAVTLASSEPFAIGLGLAHLMAQGNFASASEVNRDNEPTLAAVVDATEKMQSYNTAVGGDASYVDSGFTADLSAGMEFEVIVEVPSTANSLDDLILTVKMRDAGGTMRTILDAVSPVATTVFDTANVPALAFFMNQDFELTYFWYKLEKAA